MRHNIPQGASVIFLALLVSMPLLASAENACQNLTRSLAMGARGSDVLELQRYLINDGQLLSDYATGYFGPLTQEAVGNWQRQNNVVASRDSAGWGTVGPRTRAALALQCGGTSPQNQTTGPIGQSSGTTASTNLGQCKVVPTPVARCATSWRGVRSAGGCISSWFCVSILSAASTPIVPPPSTSTIVSATNKPPLITSFRGPTELHVGEAGAWSVAAADPEGSALTYSFEWGDSSASAFDLIQQFAQSYSSMPNSTHAYSSTGSYHASVTVHDVAGNTTQTSLSITVSRPSNSAATSTATSTNPGTGIGGTGAWCNSAVGIYQHGQTVSGQLISGGPFTYSVVVPLYTCTNGTWVCTQYCSVGQKTPTTTGSTTATPLGNGAQYWCFTASTGNWSSTPCPNNVEHDPTNIGTGNPFGSSNADAQIGGICAPDGRQEFLACPAMQNCFGGGTYLLCSASRWVAM